MTYGMTDRRNDGQPKSSIPSKSLDIVLFLNNYCLPVYQKAREKNMILSSYKLYMLKFLSNLKKILVLLTVFYNLEKVMNKEIP